MQPLSLVLIITVIFLCQWPSKFVSADDKRYLNCSGTFDCGNIKNIGYPFWASNRLDYCGHQAFHLNCINNTAEITILNLTYQVLEISSEWPDLKVARKDYIGGICPKLFYNTTLDATFFNYSSGIQDVTLYYDCPDFQNPHHRGTIGISSQFICILKDRNTTGYYVTRNLDSLPAAILGALGTCKNRVMVPAIQSALQSVESNPTKENLVIALEQGFVLQWRIRNETPCETCRLSHGSCGHNSTTGSFACYCSGQPYPFSCSGSSSNQPESEAKSIQGLKIGAKSIQGLKIELGIAAAATSFITICLVLCYCYRRKQGFWRNKLVIFRSDKVKQDETIEAFIMNYRSFMPRRYSFADIEKMTNSFMDKLGQGGFGEVYKGQLPDGSAVAVIVLNKSVSDGEEFINEVASISRTSHLNIVTLLGFCYTRNRRALIYEYMPNGSLDKFIYKQEYQQKNLHLGWKTLYDIAIGIARGLEYLHSGCNTRIIHFDIKPQNVLLDKDFHPKISDFGLAKLCKGRESIVSVLGARGTAGYIAPEVFMRSFGVVSYKSDVYSYGMMILEIFGGNDIDIEVSESSEKYFPDSVYKHLKLRQMNTADENITIVEEETTRRMIIIGLWCIQTNPSDRPSMTKVVEMLESEVQSLQIPPKPVLFSTSSAPAPLDYSNTLSSTTDVKSLRDEEKVLSLDEVS